MTRNFIATLLFSFLTSTIFAQTNSLRHSVAQIISAKRAEVGLSVLGLENNDTLSINNSSHYPLQSVFKFHIALTVLRQVDLGKFRLTQNIYVKKSDLLPGTYSPLRDKYPNANVPIPLAEILTYMVSESDNNGCDILLRLVGGAATVNNYIHQIGIKDVAINASEEDMHKEWNVQFTNWTTPAAATALLKTFYDKKILSPKSYSFLLQLMTETPTGKNRIKGQLPAGTAVAHKTGTSDTNKQGITAAINDIGIVTLPNGKHFAISVFVTNSKENTATNEKIIADISKLTWDYFMSRGK